MKKENKNAEKKVEDTDVFKSLGDTTICYAEAVA